MFTRTDAYWLRVWLHVHQDRCLLVVDFLHQEVIQINKHMSPYVYQGGKGSGDSGTFVEGMNADKWSILSSSL